MISHIEAEALISARLDQALDPVAERELSAHLATCSRCRAFADASDRLAAGLRELPYLPPSTAVSRGVMARVAEGRSPWARFGGFLNTNPGPAFSTFAVIAVLFLLGFFVFNRFMADAPNGPESEESNLASQPTAVPTQNASFTLKPTETPAAQPTETSVPTEEATGTMSPTATTASTVEPTADQDGETASSVGLTGLTTPGSADRTAEPTASPYPSLRATLEPTATSQSTATATPEPTATSTPQPTATSTPEPTATATPEPTATVEPTTTATPEPTATAEPTSTPEPTATAEPTSTPEPTASATSAPTATTEPTATATSEPTATATAEPTATVTPEPTATATPTLEPTATATPAPTSTPQPTATAIPEPTATATVAPTATATTEPTEEAAPAIVPIDGGEPIQAPEDVEPTSTSTPAEPDEDPEPNSAPVVIEGVGGSQDDVIPIEPIEGSRGPNESDDDNGEIGSPARDDDPTPTETTITSEIERIGDDAISTVEATEVADATETVGATETAPTQPADDSRLDLAENSVPYGGIAGDPGGRLVLEDGRMEYAPQAHAASLTAPSGLVAQAVPTAGGQAVAVCSPGGECTELTSASSETGSAVDTPLGWLNSGVVYVRQEDGSFSYRYLDVSESGTEALSDDVLVSGGSELAPTTSVYRAEDRIWVVTRGGDWLSLSPDGGQQLPGGGGVPSNLRFANTVNQGLLVAYVSNGQLIVARAAEPGNAILALPFSGADYDIAPSGDQVVVSTGSVIEIYDLGGTLVESYASSGMSPGTVLWLNDGIVYVDTATGRLMQIPETAG